MFGSVGEHLMVLGMTSYLVRLACVHTCVHTHMCVYICVHAYRPNSGLLYFNVLNPRLAEAMFQIFFGNFGCSEELPFSASCFIRLRSLVSRLACWSHLLRDKQLP